MKCPICKKPVERHSADSAPTFPFCSERCKLIDLGRWLSGRYSIPVEPTADLPEGDPDGPQPNPNPNRGEV